MRTICEHCGAWTECDRHHVFGGTRRKISEKYGAVVDLCHTCHMDLHHGHPERYEYLKEREQVFLMHMYGWTEDEFRSIFGKSYLQ